MTRQNVWVAAVEKMVGWDKGGHGITQHDDLGSYTDCTSDKTASWRRIIKELPLRASQANKHRQGSRPKSSKSRYIISFLCTS